MESNDNSFMRNVYTMTSSFRHTPEIERAIQNAMVDKSCTRDQLLYCCVTGEFNINNYVNKFSEDDIRWCFDKRMEMLNDRLSREAVMEAGARHDDVDRCLAKKLCCCKRK